MEKICVLGIDVGTSGVKVLALAANGQILATAVEAYELHVPKPGWTEQNPEDWWFGTKTAIRRVLQRCLGYQLKAVGLSGQMHGMVALDSSNCVIREAILWNDQRTKSQCLEITEQAGGLEALLIATNNQMLTGYTGGKILWFKQNEPEHYEKTKCIINPKDYIRFRLTGELATDVSDASGFGFYDVRANKWNFDLIKRCGLNPDIFPRVVESTAITGSVTAKAAEECGLPQGLPVAGGGGDAVISTTGLGVTRPGRVAITLGTSGVVAVSLTTFMKNPAGRLQLFRGNSIDSFSAMGVTLAAAGAYQWYRDALGDFEKNEGSQKAVDAFKLLDDSAATVPAGSDGLIFLPYLNGERCPVNDPTARGGFIGLTAQHKKAHFTRSVLEGVAYSLRQVHELMVTGTAAIEGSREIVLAGGGASSKLWRQIIADVFDMPVHTVYGSAEGGSFGAALVAGVAAEIWPDFESTLSVIKPESETWPDQANHLVYNQMFAKYTKLYEALRWSFKD